MNLTRRLVVKGVLFAAASGVAMRGRAVASGFAVTGRPVAVPASMIVFDSRSPQSRNWRWRGLHSAVDVAHEHANFWRTLRRATPRGRVVGLTAWSDLVLVRGLLEEKGLRLRAEARCGRLFYWEMS
jgi:hypothetical protein